MNQLNRLVKRFSIISHTLRLVSLILAVGLLPGCILPIPHSVPRSSEVHGRVLDAITQAPIQGAKLSFIASPHHPVFTDAAGYFHRKEIWGFYWGYVFYDDWPPLKLSFSQITHAHYLPVDGDWQWDAGDILMKPEKASTH
jgi:hypothetical protein